MRRVDQHHQLDAFDCWANHFDYYTSPAERVDVSGGGNLSAPTTRPTRFLHLRSMLGGAAVDDPVAPARRICWRATTTSELHELFLVRALPRAG